MKSFNLSYEIKCYAVEICSDVKNKKLRIEIIREYSEHLEDATYHYMLLGMTEKQAFDAACADLGDIREMQTLLSAAHNRDRLPSWFKYFIGGMMALVLVAAYLLVPVDTVRTWILFLLEICGIALIGMLLWKLFRYIRAICKRLSARKRIKGYAEQSNCIFSEHSSPFASLLRMSEIPEWVLETDKRRYIISLFPTVERRKLLHFDENGLYTSGTLHGFFMKFAYGTLSPSVAAARACELPSGIYRIPNVKYEKFHSQNKENVHVLMLNPVPYEVDLCENNHVRYIFDHEHMPGAYGNAILFSASGFVKYLEHEEKDAIK